MRALLRSPSLAVYLLLAAGPALTLVPGALAHPPEAATLLSGRLALLLLRTVALAACVAVVALVVGAPAAFAPLARGRWSFLLLLPLAIPSYVSATAWLSAFGSGSAAGGLLRALTGRVFRPEGFAAAALVLGLTLAPVVALAVARCLDALPRSLAEAAGLMGGEGGARRVLLPLVAPAAVAAAVLVFSLALVEHGVYALLQTSAYALEIHAEFGQGGEASAASWLALPLVAAAALPLALASRRLAPLLTPREGASCRALAPALLSRRERSVAAGAAGVLVAASATPALVLVSRAWGDAAAGEALRIAVPDLLRSLGVAAGAALLAAPVAVAAGRALLRARSGAALTVLLLPLALPSSLYAMGTIEATTWAGGSLGALALAHAGRLLPFALLAALGQLLHVDPLLGEAAALAGVTRWRRAVRVEWPLLSPALLSAAGITAVLSTGEVAATVLLVPPGQGTLALRAFNYLHYGASETVAALALLGMAGTLLPALALLALPPGEPS